MAQEHLAVANDPYCVASLARRPLPTPTAPRVVRSSVQVRSVVPAAIASDDRPRARIATDRDSAMTPPPARPLSLERVGVAE